MFRLKAWISNERSETTVDIYYWGWFLVGDLVPESRQPYCWQKLQSHWYLPICLELLRTLVPIMASWLMASHSNIGAGNGLMSDNIQALPETILIAKFHGICRKTNSQGKSKTKATLNSTTQLENQPYLQGQWSDCDEIIQSTQPRCLYR